MEIIKLEDRIIYRAKKGKKLKLGNDSTLHSEIVVKEETNRIIEVRK